MIMTQVEAPTRSPKYSRREKVLPVCERILLPCDAVEKVPVLDASNAPERVSLP